MKKYDVEASDFIRVWMESPTAEAVGTTLGLTTTRVRTYAAYLRQAGVKLPVKGSGRPKVIQASDVADLNEQIANAPKVAEALPEAPEMNNLAERAAEGALPSFDTSDQ